MGRRSAAALANAVSDALVLSSICASASDLEGVGSPTEPYAQACDDDFDPVGEADPFVRSVLADLGASPTADASIYRAPVCIDAGAGGKPLMALSATRLYGARCAVGSRDCSLLAIEFTEGRACLPVRWRPVR